MITNKNKFFTSFVCLSLILMSGNTSAYARSAVTTKTEQTYRGLIIQGERPEIVSCMTAATRAVKESSGFDRIRWNSNSTDTALMNEELQNDQLVRSVHITAAARVRAYSFFDNYEKVEISCNQVNQSMPRVTISSIEQ